jgi:hypothetical protein
MVAPGKNLEFGESDYFAAKTASNPGLVNRVTEHLKNWPQAGKPLCGEVRVLRLEDGPEDYVVLFLRKKQLLTLLNVFKLPEDLAALGSYVTQIREIFCAEETGGQR